MHVEFDSEWNVVGWEEFQLSIPDAYRSNPKVMQQVKYWYHREVEMLAAHVRELLRQEKPYHAYFSRVIKEPGHSQMQAHFNVKDLSQQDDPSKANWHGQNTSQWVYAGALVIDKHAIARGDERVVSTHH